MPWAAAAAVVGAGISAGASNRASKGQKGAADAATAQQWDMYQQQRTDQSPWRNAGVGAIGALQQGLGLLGPDQKWETRDQVRERLLPQYRGNYGGNGVDDAGLDIAANAEFADIERMRQAAGNGASGAGIGAGDLSRSFSLSDFQKDPGYDFRLNQGLDSVQGSRAARGSMLSGSTLKALSDYGSNYASSEYGKAYDRFNNDQATRFNRLASIAGVGQNATNNVGTAGAQYAASAGSNMIGAGNAAAAGTVGTANAISGGLSNLQSLYQLNQMNGSRGGGAYTSSYSGGGGMTANNDGFFSGGTDGTAQLPWGG